MLENAGVLIGMIGAVVLLTGIGLVVMGYVKGARLRRLRWSHPVREFREATEGTPVRVRGRVLKTREPRWRNPVDGEPVVLARLVVRNTVKVVVDISHGQAFEIENETGERAEVEISGAVIEGPTVPVRLKWPPTDPLREFVTPRAHAILDEMSRPTRGAEGAVNGFASLCAVGAEDEIEVMGVVRRDPSKRQSDGYREVSAELVLGGAADPPVVVVKGSLEAELAQSQKMAWAGWAATGVGAAMVGAVVSLAALLGD